MDAREAIRLGDRVEFKKIIAQLPDKELAALWVPASVSRVQDFGTLVQNEMLARGIIRK